MTARASTTWTPAPAITCGSDLQGGNVLLLGADRIGLGATSNILSAPFMGITRCLHDIGKPGCCKELQPERRAGARRDPRNRRQGGGPTGPVRRP